MLGRWSLAVLATASLGACAKHVAIVNDVDPSAPATAFVLGEKVGEGSGPLLELELPASYTKTEGDGTHSTACLVGCDSEGQSSALTVRLQTRCGPVEYCVDSRAEAVDGIALSGKVDMLGVLRGRMRPSFATCMPEVYRLWVDNRGGAAIHVVAGSAARDVAAGATLRLDVAAPPCAGMGAVSIDGRVVGQLPTIPDGLDAQGYENSGRDFLVDPSGARCYRFTKFYYGASMDSPPAPDRREYLRGHLHPLAGRIDGFLVAAPESVLSPVIDSRTQLLEVQCLFGPKPSAAGQ